MEGQVRSKPRGRRPRLPRGRNRATRTSTSSATVEAAGKSKTVPGSDMTAPLQILQAVWVRHRNQHHTQPWWKTLSLLRKWVARIVDLEERERGLTTAGRGPGLIASDQRRKGPNAREIKDLNGESAGASGDSTMSKLARRNFEEQATLRTQREAVTGWLRDTICPRCYIGFSSVVVDSQFANLGVVLMAALADVVTVVGQPRQVVADTVRGPEHDAVAANMTLTARTVRITGTAAGSTVERIYDSDDLGEVIERRPDRKRKSSDVDDRDEEDHGNEAARPTKQVPSLRTSHPSDADNLEHRRYPAVRRGLSSRAAAPGEQSKTVGKDTRKAVPGTKLNLATGTDSVSPTQRPTIPEDKDAPQSLNVNQEHDIQSGQEQESTSATETMVTGRTNPDLQTRTQKIQRAKSTNVARGDHADVAETGEPNKRQGEKTPKKSKSKMKKKNAIDDLFAGFG